MRPLLLCLMLLYPLLAHAEGIAEVLQRSQQARIEQRGAADLRSTASARVRSSLERLLSVAPIEGAVELVIVGGGLYAEALFGRRAVAASEAVGELPEGERLLMLAHELGHLRLGHWRDLSGLYASHIPGDVRPETTDPVAAQLSAEAHALSHRHEFEADRFGFTLVRQLGYGASNAFGLLTRQGMQFDTATHPGTRRRLAQLRALDVQLGRAGLLTGEGEAVAAKSGSDPR